METNNFELQQKALRTEAELRYFNAETLTWFSGIMDKLRLLNKTLDLSYKPNLTPEERIKQSHIADLLMHMSIEGRKLPPELSKIVNRHYPEL